MELELPSRLLSRDVLLAFAVLLATPLLYCVWWAYNSLWRTPQHAKRVLEAQDIEGLPFHIFLGNLLELGETYWAVRTHPMPHITHNIISHVIPHYHRWTRKYGSKRLLYWYGTEPHLFVTDLDDAKEILSTKLNYFPKPSLRPDMVDLVGKGMVLLHGDEWALHRRIVGPAFFHDKLKAMLPTMVTCISEMVKKWDPLIEAGQEFDVSKEWKVLTADVIARTGFGSNYAEGKKLFEMQFDQFRLAEKIGSTIYFPGRRFLPTALNRQRWKIDRDINKMVRQMIERRMESTTSSNVEVGGDKDLLSLMMATNKGEGSRSNGTLTVEDIIGECKTFFIAGHETTATTLTWSCLMLALYPEWQERLRKEVLTVVGDTNLPTPDAISQLKQMGMVLNEVLRLYTPAPVMTRKAAADVRLGGTMIPKGTVLVLPVMDWHHDEKYWGPDVYEFKPERFSEGAASACKVPAAFAPFSAGPHICIGQFFALQEAKAALTMILQRFRFRLCASYKHSPVYVITLQPQYGVPMIFERL